MVTLLIAEYAQNRLELLRAAATSLGRAVLRDSVAVAVVAGVASFADAALPLTLVAVLPTATWLALVTSVAALGGLGALLARQVGGRAITGVLGLLVTGIAVMVVGVQVDLV